MMEKAEVYNVLFADCPYCGHGQEVGEELADWTCEDCGEEFQYDPEEAS